MNRKRKNILMSIIAFLLIIIATCGISLATAINGKEKENSGLSYHEAFQDKGAALYGITWNDVKNKYYGAGRKDEYAAYIYGSKDGYCLNEKTSNSGGYFYVASIIDIEGVNVKVYSDKYNDGTTVNVGEVASDVAKMVYLKYNYPDIYTFSYGNGQNKYYVQYWMNHYGWNNLHDQIGTYIGDDSVAPTYKKYDNLNIDSPYYDLNSLSCSAGENLVAQNGKFNVNGKNYQTKIGPYTISKNAYLKLMVKATVGETTYTGIENNGYLYFTERITEEPSSITISQSYEGYKARLIVLATGWQQSRMIAYGNKTTISKSVSAQVPEWKVNVSLQKYITKVVSNTNTTEYNRSNTGAYGAPNINYIAQISTNNKTTVGNQSYKKTNPVQIEAGDYVTYRIYVYNNGNNTASEVIVTDTLPESTDIEVSTVRGSYCTSTEINKNEETIPVTVKATIEELPAGQCAHFDVTVHFTTYISEQLWNTARITSTTPSNKTSYRTQDGDSVIMKPYEVSLEKYISSVQSGSDVTSYAGDNQDNAYKNIINYLLSQSGNDYIKKIDQLRKNADINNDEAVDTGDLELLNNYIKKVNLEYLKNNYNANIIETLKNYQLADVDRNGIINEEDINLRNFLEKNFAGTGSLGAALEARKTQAYDINYDGKIDDDDIKTYKMTMLDVNEDNVIDEKDMHILLLMTLDLNKDNKIDNKDISLLKLYMLNENGYSKENIEEYIKYDLNEDGIINDTDINVLDEIFNTYKDKADELRQKNSMDYSQLKDKILEAIELCDINNNGRVEKAGTDGTDGYLLRKWLNGNYDKYRNMSEDALNTEISNTLSKEAIEYKYMDINKLDTNSNGDVETSEIENLIGSLEQYISNFDINGNGMIEKEKPIKISDMQDGGIQINDSDYVIAKVLAYGETKEQIKTKIEEYKESIKLFDINADGLVNSQDVEEYDSHQNSSISISENLYTEYSKNNFIDFTIEFIINNGEIDLSRILYYGYPNIDNNGGIDENDYQLFNQYLKDCGGFEAVRGIDLTVVSIDKSNTELLEEITEAKGCSIDLVDINNDGLATDEEISLIIAYTAGVINYSISEETIQTIIASDIDGDGNFTANDLMLWKNYDFNKLDINDDGNLTDEDINLLVEIINTYNVEESIIVNAINRQETTNRAGKAEYLTKQENKENTYIDNTINDKEWTQHNWDKFNKVVTVGTGDYVTYTIKVTNDSTATSVKITEIKDILPLGISEYSVYDSKGAKIDKISAKKVTIEEVEHTEITITLESPRYTLLAPGESTTVTVTVKVSESNMSLEVFKNTAEISGLKNSNGTSVIDTTPNNNKDSDYFQMDDITISGTVWNDKALKKTQDNYNGIYDSENEKGKKGIKVCLYRYNGADLSYDLNLDGIVDKYDSDVMEKILLDIQELPHNVNADFNNDGSVDLQDSRQLKRIINSSSILIKTTTTDDDGNYSFKDDYIKGPKIKETNRWAGTYYSYYVVFEYDGITYTSTFDTNGKRIWAINENGEKQYSNAQEDGAKVEIFREDFNAKFSTINNKSKITYTTTNEKDYIPQSIHKYNSETMAMQSSTDLISLSNTADLESQLQHVNLGLRGRDIFDLELTSDVDNIKVTVNNIQGVYKYSNKVTLRKSDLTSSSKTTEDMANTELEDSHTYVYEDTKDRQNGQHQNIRSSDLDVSTAGTNGEAYNQEKQGISNIEVTYKITVHNASRTAGTATKVIDYYDKDYSSPTATLYKQDGNKEVFVKNISIPNNAIDTSGTNYNSVELNVGEDIKLNQSESYYIHLTLTMNVDNLKTAFAEDGKLNYPTFNMAEIAEYITECASGQTEYTRGLLDKDSEPGSASIEKVRKTDTGNEDPKEYDKSSSTVEYYFGGENLSKLKYEDDTYATPTLYFVVPYDDKGTDDTSDDYYYERTITGTVFEDKTTVNPETKIKTGNGKLDEGEVGVYGATVELVELKTGKNPQDIAENEGTVRYTVPTKEDGTFTISGFLPGYYVIRYRYGDTINTVLLNQSNDKKVNKKSYNGEDYQSTNNAFEVQDEDSNVISNILDSSKGNLWYVTNEEEGISTGTDNEDRRYSVHDTVMNYKAMNYKPEYKKVLNNMRDMIGTYSEDNNGTLIANRKYNINKTEIVEIPETKVTGINDVKEQTKMYATTPQMLFTVEKTIELGEDKKNLIESKQITVKNDNSELGEWAVFPNKNSEYYKKYEISNMNFGIAELPKTTINLKKHVKSFTLYDSTGDNLIAGLTIDENGEWTKTGDVIYLTEGVSRDTVDVSVEDEKLQGARLRITYEISTEMESEINYNGILVPTKITEVVDYIDNNLSYNPTLGENGENWQITTYSELNKDGKGLQQSDENEYTTIVKAKEDNPILLKGDGTGKVTITLEEILSSPDTTIEDIITSTVDIYKYSNTVEITKISQPHDDDPTTDQNPNTPDSDTNPNPPDTPEPLPPTKNTVDKFPVPPAQSEDVTIHPPTGDSEINIIYLIIGIISLGILAVGAFCIKKFVLKNNK